MRAGRERDGDPKEERKDTKEAEKKKVIKNGRKSFRERKKRGDRDSQRAGKTGG